MSEVAELPVEEKELDWDLKALNHPQSKYTADQKVSAATTYVLTGSLKKAATNSGVPHQIVRDWSSKSNWWSDAIAKVRKEKQDELDASMTTTIQLAMNEAVDRIKDGDFVKEKDGSLSRIPMKGKELAVAMAVMFDKRSLIRGDATSISSKKADPLKDIESKMMEWANKVKEAKK